MITKHWKKLQHENRVYLLLDPKNWLEPVGTITAGELKAEWNVDARQLETKLANEELYQGKYVVVEDDIGTHQIARVQSPAAKELREGENTMKNKLTDLNDHLFAQLERLGDEDLDPKSLSAEIDRAKAMAAVGQTIVKNGNLMLEACQMMNTPGSNIEALPNVLIGGKPHGT